MTPRSRRDALLFCVLLLLVTACGAGGTEDPPTAPLLATEQEPEPEPEPEPERSEPPAEAGAPSPPPVEEAACDDPLGCYAAPERVGTFDAEAIPEASGLAVSALDPDVLFLLDDAPGTDRITAARADGSLIAELPIAGMEARDTESLSDGPCAADDPTPCLYIGDIGDNLRRRDDIVVHRIVEPDLSAGVPDAPLTAMTARLRYPDGAHDAEALLVDDQGRVHIVTKAPFDRETGTTGEARLYRAEAFADGVLTDLGPVPVPEPDAPLQSSFVGNVVTGGDHRDGRVLLRTYDQVLEYIAPEGERELAGLASWTVRSVPSPPELQSEALTWAADGCGYLTAGEMAGDLWLVRCIDP